MAAILVLIEPFVPQAARARLLADLEAAAAGGRIIAAETPAEALDHAPEAEVAAGWGFPQGFFDLATQLRWVHALTAGVDHVAEVPAVRDGRIVLTRTRGVHTAMPEHVMGLILAFSRRLHVDLRNQIAHRWDRPSAIGGELRGQVLGILGLGQIGQALAALGAAFGMRVIGTKGTPEALPHVQKVVPPARLDEVLREADYLVALVPVLPATRGLLGEREFRLMKPTAVVINVSRGVVVQEQALLTALREGWIAGAGLDVFDREPLPADHPFYALEQVIITPHVSGVTPRYFERLFTLFCENVRRYVRGEALLHVVDARRGY